MKFLFDAIGWKDFLCIHEHVNLNLVKKIYANLTTKHNTLFSRVGGVNVGMTNEEFASFLDIPTKGLDLLHETLPLFEGYLHT